MKLLMCDIVQNETIVEVVNVYKSAILNLFINAYCENAFSN